MNTKNLIRKATDLHVHVGPEIIPRKFTAEDLAKIEQGKLCGACAKSHFYSTVPIIKGIKENYDIKLIGSLTLNNYVGGINPDAVYASARISDTPIVVWFPTINAENFLNVKKYEIPPEWVNNKSFKPRPLESVKKLRVIDNDGNITKETENVLKIIKDFDLVLATGHISWIESEILVKKAVDIGIKRIIITHPIYPPINMSIEKQKELAEFGALIEHCYSMHSMDKISIQKITEQIKEVKPKNCIISSDVGQAFSKIPSEALKDFVSLLKAEDINEKSFEKMLVKNPKKLTK